MSIKAEIIADSLNTVGNRLTTFVLEYPRFIHAEVLTHRCFSKNAASSRAIPIEKVIEQVIENPAMPVWWGKNRPGMQANEELTNEPYYDYSEMVNRGILHEESTAWYHGMGKYDLAKEVWLRARDKAIEQVQFLNKIGLHKQIANRILEPWFNIRIILSGTEFENFFALRAHADAQPELQALASMMLEEYNKSTPRKLKAGDWHIPFGDNIDVEKVNKIIGEPIGYDYEKFLIETKIKIAIARCARVSYFNYEGKDDYEADIKLCDRLFGNNPKHLSPTEHIASAMSVSNFCGNFCGWKQYRKFFTDENLKDARVKKG